MKKALFLPAFVLLAACGGGSEDASDVIDAAGDLSAQVSGEGNDSDLLLGFEVYPGSDVTTNMTSEGLSMLYFATDDSAEDIIAFYREAGEAKGFTLEESQPRDIEYVLRGKNDAGDELILSVRVDGERNTGDMSVRAAS